MSLNGTSVGPLIWIKHQLFRDLRYYNNHPQRLKEEQDTLI